MYKKIIILTIILIALIPVSFAENITITPENSIQEGINNLTDGGELILTPGEYTESQIIINKSITITGENATINGNHKGSIFEIEKNLTVNFKNINFINGNSNQSGGAIYADTTDIIIDNCQFINNTAERFGAGIYIDNGTLKLNNSIFKDNYADYDGGAIAITRKPGTLIENSIFINNTAPKGWGGTFYNWYCDMEMKNVTITGGVAETGGAIFNAGNLIITDSKIYNNTATDTGGALYNYANSAIIKNTQIYDNKGVTGSDISLFRTTTNTQLNDNWWGINNPINTTEYPQNWSRRYLTDYDQTVGNPTTWINLETTLNTNTLTVNTKNNKGKQIGLNTNATITNGNEIINADLTTGEYITKINFDTVTTQLNYQTITNTLNTTNTSIINAENMKKTYKEDKNYTATLTDAMGNPIPGQHITLELTRNTNKQSKNYTTTTDYTGKYTLEINLAPGQYTIKNYYNGNQQYTPTEKTVNLTVEKINTTLETTDYKQTQGKYFKATLSAQKEKLAGEKITLKITQNTRSKEYTLTTDTNGEISLQINLAIGEYTIQTTYAGTSIYQANTQENTITVI